MKKLLPLAASIVILSGTACEEEGGPLPPPPPPGPRNTPAEVLKTVEISFNQREIEILKKSLSPDFVFYFDPDDVGQNPPGKPYIIPESWSYTEFGVTVAKMFRKAYSIKLTIPTSQIGTPDPGQTTYKAENVPISLLVMLDGLQGYIAGQGYCNFAFESYTSEAGKKFWRLTGWWDRTAVPADGRTGLAPTSLGRILSLFR